MKLSLGKAVCSGSARPGDKYVADITEPVTGPGGFLIPAGSRAVIEIARVTTGSTPDSATITFRVRSIVVGDMTFSAAGEAVPTTEPRRTARESGSDRKKVIGGAIAGAVIGQILGKDTRSTVIGAATGAAAGTAAAMSSRTFEACLAAPAPLLLTLTEDVKAT